MVVPAALVKTMGAWGHSNLNFVQEIGERIKMAPGDKQATFKLLQNISKEVLERKETLPLYLEHYPNQNLSINYSIYIFTSGQRLAVSRSMYKLLITLVKWKSLKKYFWVIYWNFENYFTGKCIVRCNYRSTMKNQEIFKLPPWEYEWWWVHQPKRHL